MKSRKPNLASRNKQKGSVAVEYMILVVFLGLVVAMGASVLGGEISSKFTTIAATVATAQVPVLPTQGG